MNRARMLVDAQRLADVLCLPDGTKCLRFRESPEALSMMGAPQLEILIEHESLPPNVEGEIIPHVNPQFTSIKTRCEFAGWGV